MEHFRARLERNKTRRGRDGDPPAACPFQPIHRAAAAWVAPPPQP